MFFGLARNWYYIHSVNLALGYAAWATSTYFMVESPKWLLLKGRKTEAIVNLNYIAKINGV
jgi:hypothetical protein